MSPRLLSPIFLLRPLTTAAAVAVMVVASGCSSTVPNEQAVAPPPASTATRDAMAAPVASAAPGSILESRSQAATPLATRAGYGASVHALDAPIYPPQGQLQQPQDRELYGQVDSNPIRQAAATPVSTFSIDVDTGSYANVRRFLTEGRLPPPDAVRVEELINYFDYADAPPHDRSTPFAVHTEIAPTPWNPKTRLLRIGLQGWQPDESKLPPSNLVFLVDVSGSMNEPDRLPLAKSALRLLARQMRHQDRISLVVYAGTTGVVLEPTPGDDTAAVESALDRLEAGGSTNGAGGIELAYQMARKGYIGGGNNRVLLATDGDFNVGTTSFEALKSLVEERRKSGIALSTLGFGRGNLNDRLMEQLADVGNGAYCYIDSMKEAQKALVEQRAGTLTTIAKDVKIQVEFNPAQVAEYRLIGYENRLLKREDFNNDKVDAGDIGAGHRVTALYEIALKGQGGEQIDGLRYGNDYAAAPKGDELAFLRLRYKRPEDGVHAASRLIETPVRAGQIESAASTSPSFRLAAAVAAYGQLLRGGPYTGTFGFTDAARLAQSAKGDDPHGYAGEFVQLSELAGGLETRPARRDTSRGDD